MAAKKRKQDSTAIYKFWYATNSGCIVMTDIMGEEEALEWLEGNSQHITCFQVTERMTRVEVLKLMQVVKGE